MTAPDLRTLILDWLDKRPDLINDLIICLVRGCGILHVGDDYVTLRSPGGALISVNASSPAFFAAIEGMIREHAHRHKEDWNDA
jgi:hypothetical protein